MPHPARRQRGAALLLLLLLLGLGAAALLMGAFGRPDPGPRERATLAALAGAREALLGYAARTGRLPRPAASALDGRESARPCATGADCAGFLPWVTLGVDGTDSWGHLLRYSVAPDFTGATVPAAQALADKRVLTRRGGALAPAAGQDGCTVASPCAAAVIFSSGARRLGTAATGIAAADRGDDNADERRNDAAGSDFVGRAASEAGAPGGAFDDLVLPLPAPLLYRRMGAAGTLR